MDDMTAFERLVAGRTQQQAGPIRPVNDAAIFSAITTTQSPNWRFQSMFSAAKFVVASAIVALFGGFLLAGLLTQPSDDPLPAAHASPESAGCEQPLAEPGVYDGINDFEDAGQAYRVVLPEDYEDLAPAPLVIFLAAGGGSLQSSYDWWAPYLGPAQSVFAVAEQTSFKHGSTPTLTALIDQLGSEYCIDPRRVHAMGNSSSVYTVATLACEAPDRIASIFEGMAWIVECTPERPVPMMIATGDTDRASVTRSAASWVEAYGCAPEPLVELLGAGVTRSTYQDCVADLVLYDVEGAGHGFVRHACLEDRFDYCYPNEVFDLLTEAERFFAEHPLPE